MTRAHHVEDGHVYRATLNDERTRVTFEARVASEPYDVIGAAGWTEDGGIAGTREDPRVAAMMRNFNHLLRLA